MLHYHDSEPYIFSHIVHNMVDDQFYPIPKHYYHQTAENLPM